MHLKSGASQQLHPTFGIQLVAGLQGGIGIGTAVSPMMEKLGWVASEAAAVGETCAIAGLALSVIIGIIIVNIGVARNLTAKKFLVTGRKIESPTFIPPEKRRCVVQWRPGYCSRFLLRMETRARTENSFGIRIPGLPH